MTVQYSPNPCHVLILWSKYSPFYTALKHFRSSTQGRCLASYLKECWARNYTAVEVWEWEQKAEENKWTCFTDRERGQGRGHWMTKNFTFWRFKVIVILVGLPYQRFFYNCCARWSSYLIFSTQIRIIFHSSLQHVLHTLAQTILGVGWDSTMSWLGYGRRTEKSCFDPRDVSLFIRQKWFLYPVKKYQRRFLRRLREWDVKLTAHFYTVSRIRMCEAMAPLMPIPSRAAHGQVYLHVSIETYLYF